MGYLFVNFGKNKNNYLMFNFNLKSMKKNYWLCKTFLLAAMGLSSVAIQGYASSDVLSVAGIENRKQFKLQVLLRIQMVFL